MSDRDVRLDTEEEFVLSPKHENGLTRFLDEQVGSVPDSKIAKLLRLTVEEVQSRYEKAMKLMRSVLSSGEDE